MALPPPFPARRPRHPGAGERLLGPLLLAVVAGIFVWFFATGAGEAPAGAPPPPPSAGPALPAAAPDGELPAKSPAGWPRGSVERYDEVSVFEKIDGKADAYLLYRFRELRCASYVDPAAPDRYVDVYVYDMGGPEDAYGIYRSQRSPAEELLPAPDEACAAGGAAFLRRGPFYAEVFASDPSGGAEARALAAALSAALPAGDPPVADPPWFPAEGRVKLGFERRSVLGDEALRDAFVARYDDGTQAAVAEMGSPGEAGAAAATTKETFEFLGQPILAEARGSRAVVVLGFPGAARGKALMTAILASLEASR